MHFSFSSCSAPFHFLRLARAIVAGALGMVALPGALQAQSDDFNDGDDAGWTRYDPIASAVGGIPQNTWSFPDGGYRLQASPTPGAALGPGRAGSLRQDVTYSDFYVTADLVKWDANRTNAYGLVARVQPALVLGQTSGYIFGYVSGDHYLAIIRIDGERTRSIPGSPPVLLRLDTNQTYRLTFTGRGARLTGRVFTPDDPFNPVAVLTASDSRYAQGTAGLLAFAVNAGTFGPMDVTFDNYTATDREPPRLAASLSIFGELSVSWPVFEGEGFTLQCTGSLGAPVVWTDVTANINVLGDQNVYDAGSPGVNKFYRLKKM